MKKTKLIISISIMLLVLMAVLSGCGNNNYGYYENANQGSKGEAVIVGENVNRKIVYEVSLSLVVDDVNKKISEYSALCSNLNGYIYSQRQDEYDNSSSSSIVFKIPTKKLDEFVNSLGTSGKLESKSISTQDITSEYVDAEAELKSLNDQKTALQALLADTTLAASEKILLISKIGELDKKIQSITLTLEQYDSAVDFSTIYVYMTMDLNNNNFVEIILPLIFIFVLVGGLIATIVVLSIKLSQERIKNKIN